MGSKDPKYMIHQSLNNLKKRRKLSMDKDQEMKNEETND